MNKTLLLSTVALIGLAGAAAAECTIEGEGSVRILANDFQALHAVVSRAAECASDSVEVTTNETTEHKDIQVAALSTNPAAYTVAVVANGSLVPLLNEGLVRPLDDLVAAVRPEPAGQPADPDRRQDHGDRLHGQQPDAALPRRHPGRERDRAADDLRGARRRRAEAARGRRDGDPDLRQLQARLGPRRGIHQHVHGDRAAVLRGRHRRGRHQQRCRHRHARDDEVDDRLHGSRHDDLQLERGAALLGEQRGRLHDRLGQPHGRLHRPERRRPGHRSRDEGRGDAELGRQLDAGHHALVGRLHDGQEHLGRGCRSRRSRR